MTENKFVKLKRVNNRYARRIVTLLYSREFPNNKLKSDKNFNFLDYIQNSRSDTGASNTDILDHNKDFYYKIVKDFAAKVSESFVNKSYCAIIKAPSSTNLHQDFFDAINKVVAYCLRLEFEKSKSAGVCKTFREFNKDFKITTPCSLIPTTLEKILIVDDMYADGKTVGAIIKKLKKNKITVKKIEVFTPLIVG